MYGMAPDQVQQIELACEDEAGLLFSQLHAHVGLRILCRIVLEEMIRPGPTIVELKIEHTCDSHLATLLVEVSRDFLCEVNRATIDQYPLTNLPMRSCFIYWLRLKVAKDSEVHDLTKRQISDDNVLLARFTHLKVFIVKIHQFMLPYLEPFGVF